MKSKWFEYKEEAIIMRKNGISMTIIEKKLGIPRSTLSGWFKDVELTEEQRTRLMNNKKDGWLLARKRAVESHKAQRELRELKARRDAQEVVNRLDISHDLLELAFAMLYLGEGAKKNVSSIASSDPMILKFVLSVLKINYGISPSDVRCDLHLRADQNENEVKLYWSRQLGIPIERFKYVAFDKRTKGKKTYDDYHGVCLVYCGGIAIQRKLVCLYNQFCDKVSQLDMGV